MVNKTAFFFDGPTSYWLNLGHEVVLGRIQIY